jgi:hypothetical protein
MAALLMGTTTCFVMATPASQSTTHSKYLTADLDELTHSIRPYSHLPHVATFVARRRLHIRSRHCERRRTEKGAWGVGGQQSLQRVHRHARHPGRQSHSNGCRISGASVEGRDRPVNERLTDSWR